MHITSLKYGKCTLSHRRLCFYMYMKSHYVYLSLKDVWTHNSRKAFSQNRLLQLWHILWKEFLYCAVTACRGQTSISPEHHARKSPNNDQLSLVQFVWISVQRIGHIFVKILNCCPDKYLVLISVTDDGTMSWRWHYHSRLKLKIHVFNLPGNYSTQLLTVELSTLKLGAKKINIY